MRPQPLWKLSERNVTKKKVNATPPWHPFKHTKFLYFEELRTRTGIIYELENFFQTSGNRTRRIRVKAHRPFISKRPLNLIMDLVPHSFLLQLQLHLNSALYFVRCPPQNHRGRSPGKRPSDSEAPGGISERSFKRRLGKMP